MDQPGNAAPTAAGGGDANNASQGQSAANGRELPVAEISCNVQIVNSRSGEQQQAQTGIQGSQPQQNNHNSNMQVEEEKQAKESSSKESLIPESDQHQTLEESKQDASDVVKTLEEVDLAKEQAEAVASLSEEFEPRKRVRMLEKEGPTESANELTGSECIQKLEKDEGKEAPVERKSCVKDENGFIYYKCRFCGLTFNFMTTLKAHERVHDIDQPYTCNKCGESFHFMCELEYHAKTHLAQKGYKCECGRTFFQYTDLLYHRHPGEDPPPEPAVPLPVAAPIQLAPSASMPAIHPAEFPTPEFMTEGYEPKHQIRVWSDIRSKPYICQYCSKSYADSRGLAYHMYSHRGERMFNPRASRYLMCRNDNSYISSGVDLRDA